MSIIIECSRSGSLFFTQTAIATDRLIMAPWALLPIATEAVIVTRKCVAVVAAWRIADEDAMMVLAWCWWLVALFTSVWNWIELATDCSDEEFHASICSVHLLLTIFADGHCLPQRLKPRLVGCGCGTAEAVHLGFAAGLCVAPSALGWFLGR